MFGMVQENLSALKHNWFWFVLLGALLTILGFVALSCSMVAALATMLFFGYMMLIGGVFYIVGAFFTGAWGGFFLSLLAGVLYLVTGFIFVNHPLEVGTLYALFLAVFFFVEGLFRIVGALAGRFRHWGWVLFNGIITMVLGVLIWKHWPLDGLYVIGLFVGIDLIFSGMGYLMLGFAVRRLPVQ
jgi:uncharacterized membrane protein HdeD (DUF308 family)